MSIRCRFPSCSVVFDEKASYNVHCQYAHSANNLPVTNNHDSNCSVSLTNGGSARATDTDAGSRTPTTTACHEIHHPNSSFHPIARPEPLQNPGDRMYDIQSAHHAQQPHLYPHQPTYSEAYNLMSAPPPPQIDYSRNLSDQSAHMLQSGNTYAPYINDRSPGYSFHNAEVTKIAYHNTEVNKIHVNVPPMVTNFDPTYPRFGNTPPVLQTNGARANETQSQSVLDLDSQKVVYNQRGPPNGEDSPGSNDQWPVEGHYTHQQQMNLVNGNCGRVVTPNGRATSVTPLPLPSPDFSNVSNSQISSSDTRPGGRNSMKAPKNSNASWKSNEARRPKTYQCSACNKWFTSSGHLKRHYNTTLHKNAVKQSGAPDPATLPASAHHHPQKDPAYSANRQQAKGSPSPPNHTTSPQLNKMADYAMSMGVRSSIGTVAPHSFPHSPNLMAGPTELPRGLLQPSYTLPDHKSPSPITSLQQQQPPLQQHQSAGLQQHSQHTSYLQGFSTLETPQPTVHQFIQQVTPEIHYPNSKAPHVSTIRHQITQNTGNLMAEDVLNSCFASVNMDDNKLPSFSCIQKNDGICSAAVMWSADSFVSALDHGNVGGPSFVSSKETINDADNMLLCEIKQESLLGEMKQEPLFCEVKQEAIEQSDEVSMDHLAQFFPPQLQPIEDMKVTSSTGSISPVSSSEMSAFHCNECNKNFNKACYLTQHNKSFHGAYRPFKCARCGKRFADNNQYELHAEKHAGNKPYKCDQCPKTFNHKTDLRRHACLHTNSRPYSCDICGKGFIRKDHMMKHRETHQNRKSSQRKVKVEKIKTKMEPVKITC